MAGVSQEMPASVTQHVRVHMRQSRTISGRRDRLGDIRARHRTAPLARKHKGRLRFLTAPKLTQGPKFVTLNRVNAINTAFEASNVQVSLGDIDLIPAQIDGFGHPQSVPSHDEN
jgi:hypothetical protein